MRLFIAVCSVVVAGCSSTLSVDQISNDEQFAGSTGIPFTLTKPEYLVTKGPKEGAPHVAVYTVSVNWVPDPDMRFAVKADAQGLAEIDFSMTLGTEGQLTAANSASRDQLVPTITSVGQFVTEAVKLTALSAADTSSQLSRIISRVDDNDSQIRDGSSYRAATQAEKDAWLKLSAEWRSFSKSSQFAASAYPRNEMDRMWIATAHQRAADANSAPGKLDAALLKPLLNLPRRELRNRHASCLEITLSALRLSSIDQIGSVAPKRCAPPPLAAGQTVQDQIRLVQAQWNKVVGVESEAARLAVLAEYLASIPAADRGGDQPAFADYVLARAQLDQVIGDIAKKRGALRGKIKPKTSDALVIHSAQKSTPATVAANAQVVADKPAYVVVIEKGVQP
jgi:hypothetical protein